MNSEWIPVMESILEYARVPISTIRASDWYEQNMVMPPGQTIPGPFLFRNSPYFVEPLNKMMFTDPTREITVMSVNQIGKTNSLINAIISYWIANSPCPIQYLTGHEKNIKEAMQRLDFTIDNTGLRSRLKDQSGRVRKTKSGDTDNRKDFIGGFVQMGSLTNATRDARQYSIRGQIRDDMDAAKIMTASGATHSVFKGRTKAFGDRAKILNISTPEISGMSNIELRWNASDKRFYYLPCPRSTCHNKFAMHWHGTDGRGGIVWKMDAVGNVIPISVEYICPHCGNGVREKEKFDMMQEADWIPSEKNPKEPLHCGYHLNALVSPPGSDGWLTHIYSYLRAFPSGGGRNELEAQSFTNLVEGLPYVKTTDEISATDLMLNNRRPYPVGVVPEDLSIRDGNGKILMLTCALDLNGVYKHATREDDARLDYEVLAWSETGATYSIEHGSIGTFIFRETEEQKQNFRQKWTYDIKQKLNVWGPLRQLLSKTYEVSGSGGRRMKILLTALDTGNWESAAFDFINLREFWVVGVKGVSESKYKPVDRDARNVKASVSAPDLWIVDGHSIKDNLAGMIRMKWNGRNGESQPNEFMNYPMLELEQHTIYDPAQKVILYQHENFFGHYEAEHKVPDFDKSGNMKAFVWKKKSTFVQNHTFDLRVYNMSAREIFLEEFLKDRKRTNAAQWKDIKYFTWPDYVRYFNAAIDP